MNIQQKFIFALIGLVFLIIHSYYSKGSRRTFTFFVFAFIAALTKEVSSFIDPVTSAIVPPPFILPEDHPILLGVMNVAAGWVFAFYLGWHFAENILKRISKNRIRIFPLITFTGLVVASFSYPIEATGINVGWWEWTFFEERFTRFLVGDIHFFAMNAWFFFSVHSLLPYYLIECSRFREKSWKNLFIFIPVFRLIILVYFGPHAPRMMYENIFLIFLLLMLFIDKFRYVPEFSAKIQESKRKVPINILPYASTFIVVGVLTYLNIFILRSPVMMLSLLPLIMLLLLSFNKLPSLFIYLFSLVLFLLFREKAIPAVFPVAVYLLTLISEKLTGFLHAS